MSTLAFITVTECDDCKKIRISKTIEEHDDFENTWYVGWPLELCPECRYKPELQKTIKQDRRRGTEAIARLTPKNSRYDGRHEYAH